MAITLESLGIDRLTAAERLSLVEQIWHSLEPGASASDTNAVPLTIEQANELDRRAADDDAHPDEVVPWTELRQQLQTRYR